MHEYNPPSLSFAVDDLSHICFYTFNCFPIIWIQHTINEERNKFRGLNDRNEKNFTEKSNI